MALCIKRKNSREGAHIKMRKKSKQKRDGLNKSGETQKEKLGGGKRKKSTETWLQRRQIKIVAIRDDRERHTDILKDVERREVRKVYCMRPQ